MKIYIALFIALMTIFAGGYVYYKNTQAQLEKLITDNASMEIALSINENTLDTLQQNYQFANRELIRVNEAFAASRAHNQELEERLAKHDLAYLARQRPGLVENAINNASDNVLRCFEILSGSELTEEERNATNGRSFNTECPWLFDSLP